MDIEFTSLSDGAAWFRISGASAAYVNALRRAMIAEVPTLAIEDVRIYDNTSALFDEMFAHRLGLIPIRTDLSVYRRRDECTCGGEGCPACTATFTMSVEGPGMVTSRDLIPQDPAAAPAYDDIPVVKLVKDQKVVVEAKAVLSTGREHAKWQPTTACGYKNQPVIRIRDNCDGCGLCIEKCPRGILGTENRKAVILPGKLDSCSLCRLCEKACSDSGIGEEPAIMVEGDPARFLFVVESDGSLPAGTILREGLRYIINQSDEMVTQIDTITGVA